MWIKNFSLVAKIHGDFPKSLKKFVQSHLVLDFSQQKKSTGILICAGSYDKIPQTGQLVCIYLYFHNYQVKSKVKLMAVLVSVEGPHLGVYTAPSCCVLWQKGQKCFPSLLYKGCNPFVKILYLRPNHLPEAPCFFNANLGRL